MSQSNYMPHRRFIGYIANQEHWRAHESSSTSKNCYCLSKFVYRCIVLLEITHGKFIIMQWSLDWNCSFLINLFKNVKISDSHLVIDRLYMPGCGLYTSTCLCSPKIILHSTSGTYNHLRKSIHFRNEGYKITPNGTTFGIRKDRRENQYSLRILTW